MSILEAGTWAAIVILGPGAVAIFVWFAWDLWKMLHRRS
jgi:hypothetical protein